MSHIAPPLGLVHRRLLLLALGYLQEHQVEIETVCPAFEGIQADIIARMGGTRLFAIVLPSDQLPTQEALQRCQRLFGIVNATGDYLALIVAHECKDVGQEFLNQACGSAGNSFLLPI